MNIQMNNKTKNRLSNAFVLIALTIAGLFTLSAVKAGNNVASNSVFSIIGEVWAGNNLLPQGRMYIYTDDKNFSPDTSFVIENGSFFVSDLDSGQNYFLYVVPELAIEEEHTPEYFPTYFSESKNTLNYQWNAAENLIFNTEVTTDSVTINLIKRDSIFYGAGKISGTVDESVWGDDLDSACVFLLDTISNPLKYTFLDSTNAFVFKHIPFGNYYLLIDKFSIDDIEHPVSIDVYSPYVDVYLYPGEEEETSTNELNISGKTTLYPNPFNDYLKINFENGMDNIHLEIFNNQGQIIQLNNIESWGNQAEINTSNLTNGIYFVKISNQIFKVQKINR